jgi:3'(2'), 5'-bisphosphate nucleotidase
MENLDAIKQAVRQAALLCQTVQQDSFHSIDKFSQDKNDKEPVTIADYGAQAIISHAIRQYFPDDAIIAEEAGEQFMALTTPEQRSKIINVITRILDLNVTQDEILSWLDHGKGRQAARTWVIDPIDGTKGFIAMRHYAIGVGILTDGQPTGAIMAAPGYGGANAESDIQPPGVLFYVQDGRAYREPLAGGPNAEIRVSARAASDDKVLIVQSLEQQHASKSRMAQVRQNAGLAHARTEELDSMEKYALVAAGDADVYLRLPNLDSKRPHMSWDHAAGAALVLAAGGKVTDYDGTPLDFSQGAILPNKGMLVSNGVFHDRLVSATEALIASEQK